MTRVCGPHRSTCPLRTMMSTHPSAGMMAALGVFGQPHLEQIYAGYHEVSALADGWQERVALHQLHMLMIHVYLFGGGYGAQAAALARRYA